MVVDMNTPAARVIVLPRRGRCGRDFPSSSSLSSIPPRYVSHILYATRSICGRSSEPRITQTGEHFVRRRASRCQYGLGISRNLSPLQNAEFCRQMQAQCLPRYHPSYVGFIVSTACGSYSLSHVRSSLTYRVIFPASPYALRRCMELTGRSRVRGNEKAMGHALSSFADVGRLSSLSHTPSAQLCRPECCPSLKT